MLCSPSPSSCSWTGEGRKVDYYRKPTPFLSYETTEVFASEVPPGQGGVQAINVYAAGGGYAFNVLANIVQTVMLAHGIDVRIVADVLGRSDVSTTLRTYVHSTEGATRRAAQAMGEVLSS